MEIERYIDNLIRKIHNVVKRGKRSVLLALPSSSIYDKHNLCLENWELIMQPFNSYENVEIELDPHFKAIRITVM